MSNRLKRATFAPATAAANKAEPSRKTPDGFLHVRKLSIAPSDLCSHEFNRFYAGTVVDSDDWVSWPVPARTASSTEWARFDAWLDERCNEPLLKSAHKRYPVKVEKTSIAGVAAAVVTPREGVSADNDRRIVINLHGGAFVFNRGLSGGLLEAIPVAAIGRLRVVTLDYRQAPFHRYPAASEDVEAVYRQLLQQYRPEAIGIYGCSAGGVLAAQAIARLQSLAMPQPGAVGIFNIAPPPPFSVTLPWDQGWGDSRVWFSSPPRNEPSKAEREMGEVAHWYMEGVPTDDPCAYPGSSDAVLAKFPSTLLLTGTRDYAASTVIATHARLLKLGVDSSLYVMEGAPHAAHVTAVDTPEAYEANAHVARWLGQHLAR